MRERAGLVHVLDRRFRANPCYRLTEHAALPAEQRERFAELAADSEHFGVLVPESRPELGVHAVDRGAARLFAALRVPGPLPAGVREVPGEDPLETNRRLALLVLDGVLEVERDGSFLSGPDAHVAVLHRAFQPPRPLGPIAALSHSILRRAQTIPIVEPRALCSWIYSSGVLPVGPEAARRWPDWEAVERSLGLDDGGPATRCLERYHRTSTPGWSSWHLDGGSLRYSEADGSRAAYKLYVRPHPRALTELLPPFLTCVREQRAPAFKVGRDVYGLHRPDKLIVYFDDLPALEAFVLALAPRVEGLPAHGVPFTAGMDEAGLFSWGVDPPRANRIPGWGGDESWRTWLTSRLARAILRARAAPPEGVAPWLCALDRMRVEGVDPDVWLPVRELWQKRGEA